MRSALSRTTRAASLRCYSLISGSENAPTFLALLFGSMMLHAFAALSVKSVGKAANEMVKERMQQFPKIIDGSAEPD